MTWLRRARPASTEWSLAKTAVQIAVFWGVFLFLLPPWVVAAAGALGWPATPVPGGRLVATVIFTGAGAFGLLSGYTMAVRGRGTPLPIDAPRNLVMVGPYRWVRNPMALAGITQGTAVALWFGSVPVLAYALAGGLLWHVVVRPVEERDLAATFGPAFERYRAAVPLWIPRRPTVAGALSDRRDA